MHDQFGGAHGLLTLLESHKETGIKNSSLAERVASFGNNNPLVRNATTFFEFVWECFEDLTLRILIVASIVSLCLGLYEDPVKGWLEGVAIMVAILIVVLVTSINNYVYVC